MINRLLQVFIKYKFKIKKTVFMQGGSRNALECLNSVITERKNIQFFVKTLGLPLCFTVCSVIELFLFH